MSEEIHENDQQANNELKPQNSQNLSENLQSLQSAKLKIQIESNFLLKKSKECFIKKIRLQPANKESNETNSAQNDRVNNEIAKLRLRCNSDTQKLSHIREKNTMLEKSIKFQVKQLTKSQNLLNTTREALNKLIIKRNGLRNKYNELSKSCGLLDKPVLLKDFDATNKSIGKYMEIIDELKSENSRIQEQIKEFSI